MRSFKTPDEEYLPFQRRALPVTITTDMPVVEVADGVPGRIVGITPAYCVYRFAETGALAVAAWHEVALGNICPADPLLPLDVEGKDRQNASAALLRELLALRQFGLTPVQQASLDELVDALCSASPGE